MAFKKFRDFLSKPSVVVAYTALLLAPYASLLLQAVDHPVAQGFSHLFAMAWLPFPLLAPLGLYLFFSIFVRDWTWQHWLVLVVLLMLLARLSELAFWIVPLVIVVLGGTAILVTLGWQRGR